MGRRVAIYETKRGFGAVLFTLTLFCAGVPRAQQAPPPSPTGGEGYTLTVRSQIVQLDVVVRNAKGELVTGLHPEDFTVTEDNVPQRIVSFDTSSPKQEATERLQVDSTAELDHRAPNAPVTIVVLDELTARFEDEYFERYSLEQYLKKQSEVLNQPMMLIARSVDRTMVLSDYTTSKKKILDALNHHLVGNDWRAQNPNFNDAQMGASFASLLEVAKATQGHPGHKNLIWIGRGFPMLQWESMSDDQADGLKAAVTKCVDLLREARITLYAIDPAGVSAPSGTLDVNGVASLDDPFDDAVSFDSLAQATGGLSMHGRNDVDHLIGDAVANGETFYTLAYRPSSPQDADPTKFRTIKVLLKDNTLVATSRQGYYPVADQPSAAEDAKGKLGEGSVFDLASASTGLMVFDGLPLSLQSSSPDAVQISLPALAIGMELADGKLRADLTVITLGFDRTGKLLNKDGRVVSLHLAELQPGQTESRKVQIMTPLKTQGGVARVRVVVRSNANGKIGADNIFLTDKTALKDPATGVKAR